MGSKVQVTCVVRMFTNLMRNVAAVRGQLLGGSPWMYAHYSSKKDYYTDLGVTYEPSSKTSGAF